MKAATVCAQAPAQAIVKSERIPPGGFFNVITGPVCEDDYAWYQVEYNGIIGWTAEAGEDEYWIEFQDEAQRPILLTGGIGLTSGARMGAGEFQVEYYCNNQGYGITNDDNNWYCTSGGSAVQTLSQADFSQICRDTYPAHPEAFALQDGEGSIPAYRWQCYGYADN